MTVEERIRREERNGELTIDYFRMGLGLLFSVINVIIVIARYKGKFTVATNVTFVGLGIFIAYGAALFFYLRRREIINPAIKYVSAVIDMAMVSLVLFSTRFDASMSAPAAFFLSRSLIYFFFIIFGMLRYSVSCAIFSGAVAAAFYSFVCFSAYPFMSVSYEGVVNGLQVSVSFPLDNEIFRVLFLFVAGVLVGIGSRRNKEMLYEMAKQEESSCLERETTIDRTGAIVRNLRIATAEIDDSSKSILATAHGQAASVEEIRTTVEENATIAGQITEKTGSVATIASKTEADAKAGFGILEQNIRKMGEIKDKNDHVISGIIALDGDVSQIRDIVKVINGITDQTKVIAFNAALEAASAGETGKRFAVVASETNRLADDIAALTKQIKERIEDIRGSTAALIITSEEGTDKIAEGYDLIRNLEDVFREILSGAEITSNQARNITVSTQKQSKSSEQISATIAEISRGLSGFVAATKTNAASVENLGRITADLQRIIDERTSCVV